MTCPRCGQGVRPPGLWSDAWTCAEHGAVAPLHPAVVGSDEALIQTAARSQVPLWLPWPLPQGWLVSGLRHAGDEHSGPVATVLALSGPNPIVLDAHDALAADLLLVAEQPGVGLAAHLAGLDGIDPGTALASGPSDAKLVVAGHETPMWSFAFGDDEDDTAGVAYVGEALGEWLWVLLWPRPASAVLLEHFALLDLRDPQHAYTLPYGALSPRLG
jgi:hypothetical protein